jgi:hypothetical protein
MLCKKRKTSLVRGIRMTIAYQSVMRRKLDYASICMEYGRIWSEVRLGGGADVKVMRGKKG